MKLPRRKLLHLAAGATALPLTSRFARAQAYPRRPVRVLNGFPAGGTSDIVARLICQGLAERLGQPFVVENRLGAATNIATEAVVRAPPDGYTLLVATTANTVNATLYENLKYDFIRDIAPVASIAMTSGVVVISPAFPAKSLSEFIAFAKANPGKVAMGSGGLGSFPHVAGELFKMVAGANFTHIPYRGEAPALTDLIGGQVQVVFSTMPAAIENIRAGKLRALAVTTAARSEVLPDLPPVGDFLPGYEASSWQGIGAPKNVDGEIVATLNKETNALLRNEKIKARLAELGSTALTLSPAEFGGFIVKEAEKWGRVVKFAGIKPA